MDIHTHLNRQELLLAARQDNWREQPHLRICRECREVVEMLAQFRVAGQMPFPEPPEAWVDAVLARTHKPNPVTRAVRQMAELLWDSWAQPLPVGLRSTGATEHRRLTFGVPGGITVDLRAEENPAGWTCVAEIAGVPDDTAVLVVDGNEIMCGSSGLYTWSKDRPPRTLTIRINGASIKMPGISWKRPRT